MHRQIGIEAEQRPFRHEGALVHRADPQAPASIAAAVVEPVCRLAGLGLNQRRGCAALRVERQHARVGAEDQSAARAQRDATEASNRNRPGDVRAGARRVATQCRREHVDPPEAAIAHRPDRHLAEPITLAPDDIVSANGHVNAMTSSSGHARHNCSHGPQGSSLRSRRRAKARSRAAPCAAPRAPRAGT